MIILPIGEKRLLIMKSLMSIFCGASSFRRFAVQVQWHVYTNNDFIGPRIGVYLTDVEVNGGRKVSSFMKF